MNRIVNRIIALTLGLSVAVFPVVPGFAQSQQQAGSVTAQIPEGTITRPAEQKATVEGEPVLWEDVVETTARGRVRIKLGDGSLLNVGSDSRLLVVQHNQQTRETDLTLSLGKMRSRLQRLEPGQRFEIRTNTAVVGVIGTDFFLEATATMTRVIVYEGMVLVRNINPSIGGEQRVAAGSSALVYADQPPFAPQPTEPAEVQQSLEETFAGEEPPAGPPKAKSLFRNKWFLIAAVAAIAAVSIAVPLAAGGRDATGCEVPEPSCP